MQEAKFTAIVTGALAMLPATQAPEPLGIPVAILLAAYAGALFGLAYTPPEKWGKLLEIPEGNAWVRGRWVLLRAGGLVFTLTANAFVCAWAVAALPHLPFFDFTAKIPVVPMAGLLAFASQHIIPRALGWAGRKLDRS